MNRKYAMQLLEIDPYMYTIPAEVLKRKYYIQALKFHPDKNKSEDAATRFQEISEAYQLLGGGHDTSTAAAIDENKIPRYVYLFIEFLKHILNRPETATIIQNIAEGCYEAALRLFEKLDVSQMIYLYETISKYKHVLHISSFLFLRMNEMIIKHTPQKERIILNPSIDNLLSCSLYHLRISNDNIIYDKSFLVPLWHNELVYNISADEKSQKELIVSCIPELPYNISIDENNNLYVCLYINIEDLLDRHQYSFFLGEQIFFIPIKDLQFKKIQHITLRGVGVPRVCPTDMFNTDKLGDIYVTLYIRSNNET